MKILICTDGSPSAEEAAVLVTRLGYPSETQITLLGVCETDLDKVVINSSMDRIVAALGGSRQGLLRTLRYGQPVDEILMEMQSQPYDLVVVGDRGHQNGLPLLKLGSTSGKLARRINAHLLVARNVPNELKKILICTSAESPSVDTIKHAGRLIKELDAQINLLHVMSPVFTGSQGQSDKILDTAESAIEHGTREGKHLILAMEQLNRIVGKGTITPSLRHGFVVDQVLMEVDKFKCDLLVIGAHHQPGQNRWLEILLDDVADQLTNQVPCSVLVV